MKSVIEQIYNGTCANAENINDSEQYKKILDKFASLCEEFEKGLTKEQAEVFKNITDENMGLEAQATLTYYKEGFKLGLLMGIEICQ